MLAAGDHTGRGNASTTFGQCTRLETALWPLTFRYLRAAQTGGPDHWLPLVIRSGQLHKYAGASNIARAHQTGTMYTVSVVEPTLLSTYPVWYLDARKPETTREAPLLLPSSPSILLLSATDSLWLYRVSSTSKYTGNRD